MVSEYVPGQWLFIRVGTMDCFGQFVCAKEHQVVVDVHIAEPTPAGYLPSRSAPDYHGDNPAGHWKIPPVRVDFGRAVSVIEPVEPPRVRPA